MSRLNVYHQHVIDALRDDGWTITDDPLRLAYGGKDLYCDLGAERATLGAARGTDLIAVEIQSFIRPSNLRSLQEAVGQYGTYRAILRVTDPDRRLWLAVPDQVDDLLDEPLGRLVLRDMAVKVMVFNPETRKVRRWIDS